MKAGALLPNRLHAPLTDDERLAEQYLDRPARLLELAQETRNRALYWIARELLRRPKKRERRGYEDRH